LLFALCPFVLAERQQRESSKEQRTNRPAIEAGPHLLLFVLCPFVLAERQQRESSKEQKNKQAGD